MDNITPDLLDFLNSFLEPFYAAQRELEGDKYTTLNLVCFWNEKLKKHCQPSSTDNPQQAFVRHICCTKLHCSCGLPSTNSK